MEQLISDICEKTGIDRATAEKVAGYLKDNVTKLPQLLGEQGGAGGIASKLGGFVGR
jgi:hypothetical protein